MSRAISRSFFSDSRSATSSSTSRFISANAKSSDQVPSLEQRPGHADAADERHAAAISMMPTPRNRLIRPISASSSAAPNTTRRAGDSFIENARNRSRTSAIARRCHGSRCIASASRAAREELVGVARVAREQPLQILGGQILRVGVEEVGEPRRTMAVHRSHVLSDAELPADPGERRRARTAARRACASR